MLDLETTEPIGFTLAGVPVWPLMGAEDDDPDDDATDAPDDDPDDESDDDEDDDKNLAKKKTSEADEKIAAARKQAAKYRTKLKPWNTLEAEFGSVEQIRERLNGTTTNADAEAVRKEAQNTVSAMQKRLVSATVRSLAASDFADPDDAARFVDLSSIEVDDDGTIDEDEVRAELEAILERKPHLRKQGDASSKKRRPAPDKSQGPKNNGGKSGGTIDSGRERYNRLMGKSSKS